MGFGALPTSYDAPSEVMHCAQHPISFDQMAYSVMAAAAAREGQDFRRAMRRRIEALAASIQNQTTGLEMRITLMRHLDAATIPRLSAPVPFI